ncbi:hypothetical protein [Salinisphaera sp. G21_0]|uniref:hypothetical protein n=1 Tax=Salinisphaera sp. G21_0 TaxID=2821094 RepID=UPI001ADCF115|nr:hypothetical protein [Salinisphaera sp. G21_0]MBO9480676.1 hypothetical protein [Salinisphaera sp. G21_0]
MADTSTTARASAIKPELHSPGSDIINDPENSQPSDLSLSERKTETSPVDKTYHAPELTSAAGQSQPEQSSAFCPVSDVFMKPLTDDDDTIMGTLPYFDMTLPNPLEITTGDIQNFKDELSIFKMELDQEFLNGKFLDTDSYQFHSLICNRLASLKHLADKYQAFKDSSYKLVEWYNKTEMAYKSLYGILSRQLFLSDDMCKEILRLGELYRDLNKMLCRWPSGVEYPHQQSISFLSESLVCHLSYICCLVEGLIRYADFKKYIAVRAPEKPLNFHEVSRAPLREHPDIKPHGTGTLNEGISNMLTAITTGTWENLNREAPHDILKTTSKYLFSSIDRYRKEGCDQKKFQPVCINQKTIGQHLFCAELFHAALMAGRWDEADKAFEATTRIVFHGKYSLEPVIQALKHNNNTPGINIEKWHNDFNEYTQSRPYPIYMYFTLGLEAASTYLSTLLAHKESDSEKQSPLIKVMKTEELIQILNVLDTWADQLQKLGFLASEARETFKYRRRLSLAWLRVLTLTNNHEMAIKKSFHEAQKVIMPHTASDGITNDNPQQLPEYLESRLTQILLQNNDILKLINKAWGAFNPNINISALDRESCLRLIKIFVDDVPTPHTELLLTFFRCCYHCAMIVEHICECASIFSDLETCLTCIHTSKASHSLKMAKEKWKDEIRANASGIKEKIDQFDKFNQNFKTFFNHAFSHLKEIREHSNNGEDKCLKIVLSESIQTTLYHSLLQLQHLNSALINVSSKRIDILRNEFPTIANLEQATAGFGKRLNKNIAFIARCLKELNDSKELSLANTTGRHKPNSGQIKKGQRNNQVINHSDTLAGFAKAITIWPDTQETLSKRAEFQEQIASEVQTLQHQGLPVVYLGSRAYQTQIQSLWGNNAFELATGSHLLPAEISDTVITRSVTPRDTDLLVLDQEKFSEIKTQLCIRLKKAAGIDDNMPGKYQLITPNDDNKFYYGKNCCCCNLIVSLSGSYFRKDWAYVVDLISPMDSGPSPLLTYDSPVLPSGDSTQARPLTSIMMDELNLAINQAVSVSPARSLMAMTRINVLAVLEYLEPKLDPVSRIVLMHVLERLQNSYPDPAQEKLASTLRSRAFNISVL